MIAHAVQEEVRARLRRAEHEHAVKGLLAVESGSRVGANARPNSDYDARVSQVNGPQG